MRAAYVRARVRKIVFSLMPRNAKQRARERERDGE